MADSIRGRTGTARCTALAEPPGAEPRSGVAAPSAGVTAARMWRCCVTSAAAPSASPHRRDA
eukprot:scaffold5946_cov114-Isochrysis_galbana.AAC.5